MEIKCLVHAAELHGVLASFLELDIWVSLRMKGLPSADPHTVGVAIVVYKKVVKVGLVERHNSVSPFGKCCVFMFI